MESNLVLIPHVVVHPSMIVSYNEVNWIGTRKSKSKQQIMPENLKEIVFIDVNKPIEDQCSFLNSTRKSDGTLSKQATRKLSKAIEYLVTTSSQQKVHEKLSGKIVIFKLAFITLTLPSTQQHPDSEIINKCLNSLLNELRLYHNVIKYVWRAERQKNGNIHFHLITDKFIPWYILRNRWNRIINKLGYVDRFQEKHGKKTPNSTDVHSTRKIYNLKNYLIKYLTKDEKTSHNNHGIENQADNEIELQAENNTFQSGRVWSCSQNLSKTRGMNLVIDSEIDTELKNVLSNCKVRKYEAAYFTCYFVDYHEFLKRGSVLLFKYFSDYLFEHLGFSEQMAIAI